IYTVGVMPYAMGDDFHVLDMFGLADPFTAHLDAPFRTTLLPYPGHEKPLPRPWVAARLFDPKTVANPGQLPDPGPSSLSANSTRTTLQDQVGFARATLQCPAVEKLTNSSKAPLTVGRFFRNIFDSFSNTALHIPPDPETAFHKFCGGTPS